MKKLLLLLVAFAFASCTSSDSASESTNPSSTLKLYTIKETYENNYFPTTTTTYNIISDTKISIVEKSSSEELITDYTLLNGKLLSLKTYYSTNVPKKNMTFEYENDRLSKVVGEEFYGSVSTSYKTTTYYTYSGSTAKSKEYDKNNVLIYETDLEYDKNWNLIKFVEKDIEYNKTLTSTKEYDNMKNPLSTIFTAPFSVNNILKNTDLSSDGSKHVDFYTYKYNSDGYPIEEKVYNTQNKLVSTKEYTYK
jgi:hypothetical protein